MTILMLLAAIGVGAGLMILPWLGLTQPGARSTARTAFVEMRTIDELEAVVAQSHLSPELILLHDPWCPVSAMAFRRVAGLGGRVHVVDVSHARELSRAIAERTGVRHESPQAIVLEHGRAVWSAAHSAVNRQSIARAMEPATSMATRREDRV